MPPAENLARSDRHPLALFILPALVMAAGCASIKAPPPPAGGPFAVVLGVAQDGGVPQAGTADGPVWQDPARRRLASCLGLIDPATSRRWMIDATPDFKEQLHRLDRLQPPRPDRLLDGILLTHAHIGHYLGLAHLGHEAIGARAIPVHAMPRMRAYLRDNGPWSQLVAYHNIELRPLEDGRPLALEGAIRVTPVLVPHRQEYSEVVGFLIEGPSRSVLYIPDIDSWEEWDHQGTRIETLIARVDVALLDGTFYANGEIPGRDMSGFPHPFITHSLERFQGLPAAERDKIRFLHLNHTNPALDPRGSAARRIRDAGFHVAVEGEIIPL